MADRLKTICAIATILAFFFLMSRIDFIVHGTLYDYGLKFSHEWADEYWTMYVTAFVVFAGSIALMYWLGDNRSRKDIVFPLSLFATVIIVMVTALQDVILFSLWVGAVPPANVNWVWTFWFSVLGTWTTPMQIGLSTAGLIAVALLWAIVFYIQRPTECLSDSEIMNTRNDFPYYHCEKQHNKDRVQSVIRTQLNQR